MGLCHAPSTRLSPSIFFDLRWPERVGIPMGKGFADGLLALKKATRSPSFSNLRRKKHRA